MVQSKRENVQILKQLENQSVATVHEAIGKINALSHEIKPLDQSMKFAGRALTVKCAPNDNLTLIKAIHQAEADDVLVIDMSGETNCGPFGEVLTVECLTKGVRGLVTNGSVRDSSAIIDRQFPVFSAGISVRGTYKAAIGSINEPVSVGGVIVHAGDYVLGDADGVVVISPDKIQAAIDASIKREEDEKVIMERLQNGESLFDIYGYQKIWTTLLNKTK